MTVVIWPQTDAYRGKTRDGLLQELRQALQGRCESAWLFGSFARGAERPGSDLDLLVVTNTDKPFLERAREFDHLWNVFPAIDLLVYTPDEFQMLNRDTSPGFRRSITQEKLRLI